MTATLTKPAERVVLPNVERLTFDAKAHAYKLDGTKLLTGVTSVLDGTSAKSNLIQWAANMAVDYIKNAAEVTEEEVKEVGWGDETHKIYSVLEEVLEDARTAHTRHKEKAGTKGTDMHAEVERYILFCIETNGGKPVVEAPHFVNCGLSPFIDWAQGEVKYFLAAEQRLYDEENAVGGTADFFYVSVNDELTTGDLKTFAKMWSPDAFVQTGIYSRMWRLLTGNQPVKSVVVRMCDPADPRLKKYNMPPFAVYPRYALEEDEQMFLKRLELYRYNQNFVSPKE